MVAIRSILVEIELKWSPLLPCVAEAEFELMETFRLSSLHSRSDGWLSCLDRFGRNLLLCAEFSVRLSKNSKIANSAIPTTTKKRDMRIYFPRAVICLPEGLSACKLHLQD